MVLILDGNLEPDAQVWKTTGLLQHDFIFPDAVHVWKTNVINRWNDLFHTTLLLLHYDCLDQYKKAFCMSCMSKLNETYIVI